MICVVSGEYTTQPVRTGISEAPRCLPARLISTPTWPASMRVTRRSVVNRISRPRTTAAARIMVRSPGMAGRMTNGGSSPAPLRPLLKTGIEGFPRSMTATSAHTYFGRAESTAKTRILLLRQLHPRGGEGHDRFEQHRFAIIRLGQIQDEVGVFHFGAIVQHAQFDFVYSEIPCRHGDGIAAGNQAGVHFI